MHLNFTRVIISSTFPDEIHAKLNCNASILVSVYWKDVDELLHQKPMN